jgi:hypothetical protein
LARHQIQYHKFSQRKEQNTNETCAICNSKIGSLSNKKNEENFTLLSFKEMSRNYKEGKKLFRLSENSKNMKEKQLDFEL